MFVAVVECGECIPDGVLSFRHGVPFGVTAGPCRGCKVDGAEGRGVEEFVWVGECPAAGDGEFEESLFHRDGVRVVVAAEGFVVKGEEDGELILVECVHDWFEIVIAGEGRGGKGELCAEGGVMREDFESVMREDSACFIGGKIRRASADDDATVSGCCGACGGGVVDG